MRKKRLIKSRVKFERAEIRCSQIEITSDGNIHGGTIIKLDGKERHDITRLELVVDAQSSRITVAMYLLPERPSKKEAA